jgi:uncharacterized protein (TIGR03437 family)
MYARFRLSVRFLVPAVIALLSCGAILIKQSVEYFRASAAAQTVVSVNAASYMGPLAPATITAAFGVNLATRTETAQSVPLPTQLAGVTLRIIDANNVQHAAPLFFVSAGQINYLIPDQVAPGTAQLIVNNGAGGVSQGQLQITASSPAIFTTTYSGRGLAVALTTFDGVHYESVVNPDGTARGVNAGAVWRPNYLTMFGTGLRGASNLRVRIGGVEVTPMYVGAQGAFAGLDQVNLMIPPNAFSGMTDISLTADGRASNTVQLLMQPAAAPTQNTLSVSDVQTIIAQAVAKAQQVGLNVTVGIVDREGNALGVFRMNGAPATTRIGDFNLVTKARRKPADPDGLQDLDVPASFAALSKAGTAAFFSTQGSAITTRTASFIVQENFPPGLTTQAGGPLFGVQFSSLPCSDILPALPLGLSADPGGVPIYKNGVAVGGIGIEGDGFYTLDQDPTDFDQHVEELIAVAGTFGFEPPDILKINTIQVDGMTLAYVNVPQTGAPGPAFASLPGAVDPSFPIRPQQASRFMPLTLAGVAGRVDPRFFPFKSSAVTSLTANDVTQIISQAAQQADRTRAAIRRPIGAPAEVNITVVDISGAVLGIFSTDDAPTFGFDVSAQKARTANFFSLPNAGAQLRAAGFGKFVDASAADGVMLDGKFVFTSRAMGFLARPFFPDGINGTPNGPFSKPINIWSIFNDGLQIALVKPALGSILSGVPVASCTAIPSLPHGIQIFAGGGPLYKNGVLVGAIGISGDGIDQDDIICATGSVGFEPPAGARADQLTPRGVRLPYYKFPRHPNISIKDDDDDDDGH